MISFDRLSDFQRKVIVNQLINMLGLQIVADESGNVVLVENDVEEDEV